MEFTLYLSSHGELVESAYFRLRTGEVIWYSPWYSSPRFAIEAIRTLIQQLRTLDPEESLLLDRRSDQWILRPLGASDSAVAGSSAFAERSQARSALAAWRRAAQAEEFGVTTLKSVADKEENTDPEESGPYERAEAKKGWREIDKYKLKVPLSTADSSSGEERREESGRRTSNTPVAPCAPLFNLLAPLQAKEYELFHGREHEVEALYAMTFDHRLLLLYGPPRAGKTSLVQCGLAHRYGETRWAAVSVAPEAGRIVQPLLAALKQYLAELDPEAEPETADPQAYLREIYEVGFKPVFVIFDRVEALFAPDVSPEERETFFGLIARLTHCETFTGRLILILDESVLGSISDYEELIPDLLENRYRLRHLTGAHAVSAIGNLLEHLQARGRLRVEQPGRVAELIGSRLAGAGESLPPTCLQLYIHALYQAACEQAEEEVPLITPAFIADLPPAEDMIANLLDQLPRDANREFVWEECGCEPLEGATVRGGFGVFSEEETTAREVFDVLPVAPPLFPDAGPPAEIVPPSVTPPGDEVNSIWLRRLLLVTLLLLAGSLVSYGVTSVWIWRKLDPCYQARRADSCQAYVNYLIREGREAPCAAEFAEILEERECGVVGELDSIWVSWHKNSCDGFRTYITTFGPTGIATPTFRGLLGERGCAVPGIVDTVHYSDTLYIVDTLVLTDTIIQRNTIIIPPPYDEPGPRIDTSPCGDHKGYATRTIGTLEMTTENLAGGPYNWFDALQACERIGMRLPCEGEIDHAINTFYKGKTPTQKQERAYYFLTMNGECPILERTIIRSEQTIEFWTATEATDADAWTFYVDNANGRVGTKSMDKNALRHCRCVPIDTKESKGGTPCYSKVINRR